MRSTSPSPMPLSAGKSAAMVLPVPVGACARTMRLSPDGQIDLLRQLPLARAVGRKGEGQRAHLRGQRRPAAREPVQPGEVRPHIALELLRERLTRVRAHKARDLAVRQAEVRHADLERGQVLRLAEHVRVALRLRPVQGRGLRRRALERGLDLLHAAQAVHAVRAAEHRQAHGRALRAEAQRHLVAHALLLDALQALVPAHALEQALGEASGARSPARSAYSTTACTEARAAAFSNAPTPFFPM